MFQNIADLIHKTAEAWNQAKSKFSPYSSRVRIGRRVEVISLHSFQPWNWDEFDNGHPHSLDILNPNIQKQFIVLRPDDV
jgi:hypothetical protein